MSQCSYPCCTTSPVFNYPQNEGSGKYCKHHALPGMVDVKNRKCNVEGCRIRPHYNWHDQNKGVFCFEHKLDGMTNVLSDKCKNEGCESIPSFNFPGEKKRLYCAKHLKPGMVSVVGKFCNEENCGNRAMYGFTKREKCRIHKEAGMTSNTFNVREIENPEKFRNKKNARKDAKRANGKAGKSLGSESRGTTFEEALRHRSCKLVNWEAVERLLQSTSGDLGKDQATQPSL